MTETDQAQQDEYMQGGMFFHSALFPMLFVKRSRLKSEEHSSSNI
jgi:hypothetical protein